MDLLYEEFDPTRSLCLLGSFPTKNTSKTTKTLYLSFSFFFIVYSIYYRHFNLIFTVFNILFFHGSSPFHTGTNPFANAFIFRHKEEEQKQENVPTAASNANAKAEGKEEDGTNIFIVVMEPDKEPFELQTNRRATSARTIKDYVIILWLFSL